MKKLEPIKHYESEINSWKNVILSSILAAIGVNLFVSGIVMMVNSNQAVVLLISGAIVFIGTACYYIVGQLKKLKKQQSFKGFFVYDKKQRRIVNVPRYEIAEHLWLEMMSICRHNKELKAIWEANEVGVVERGDSYPYRYQIVTTESDILFGELLEYCVLKQLSINLMEYFSDCRKDEIRVLERDEMPDILAENRILSWFSEDNTAEFTAFDRLVFDEDISSAQRMELLKTVPVPKPFSRFDMALPKDGSITRRKAGILIDHPLFSLSIIPNYNGSNAFIPQSFERLYLKHKNDDGEYSYLAFSINCLLSVKTRAFFSRKRKAYSQWIDHFLERLDEFISEETFFQRIGWETANTVLECMSQGYKEKGDSP